MGIDRRLTLLLAVASVALTVVTGEAAVTTTLHAVAPGKLSMQGRSGGRFLVRGRWLDDQAQMLNPTRVASTLRIVGTGPGDGDTGVIALPIDKWRAAGGGFEFSDPTSSTGVRRISIRAHRRGGALVISGGGPNWRYAITKPQDGVQVTLTIGDVLLWQAEFPGGCGTFKRNVTGDVRAASRRAPATSSTWKTIQKTIFARHSCTENACHGSAQSGGLDLRPKVAYANLVGVFSPLGQQNRVERGSRQDSFLWRKLAAATEGLAGVPGTPMPNTGDKLSADELEAIRLWIQAGAPETGTVPGTAKLLDSCLPPEGPLKIAAPPAPAAAEGVQFHAPPWEIPPHGEGEVCYATYYDIDAQVPADMKGPCDEAFFGPGKTCFFYNRRELTQDPNSHHSIIHIYLGTYPASDPGFGFTCFGGASDGQTCDPTIPDVCGSGECRGKPKSSLACLTFGPPDFSRGGNPLTGSSNTAPSFAGSQQPFARNAYPSGVWAALPTRGVIVWNSHAFNLTSVPTTNEQYLNLYYAGPTAREYPLRGIFDSEDIFVQKVPPFEAREYCRTTTFPKGARITDLSTHAHKRSSLFRVWGPPVTTSCHSTPDHPEACLPESRSPLLTTTEYNDPAQFEYHPPLALDSDDPAERRFKFCSVFDNGLTDPGSVKRNSTSPRPPTFGAFVPGGPCYPPQITPINGIERGPVSCLAGPKKGQPCDGSDAFCDSAPGLGDGQCDACPLRGGVTTEDEMFILLGSYYCAHGSDCETTGYTN